MENSNTAAESFDINADISRQYTRHGIKVLSIYRNISNSSDLKVMLEGNGGFSDYTQAGKNMTAEFHDLDIITRPELKPLIVDYLNAYLVGGIRGGHADYKTAENAVCNNPHHLSTIKLTYNPNDGSVAAEVVTSAE